MQVLRILEGLVVMTGHDIGQIRVHIHFARNDRHYREGFFAGGAKGAKTLNIRNCHNRIMVANGRKRGAGQNGSMDRELVLAALRTHERELKDAGVVRLSLFGSTVRGEASPDSDVDLLAAF